MPMQILMYIFWILIGATLAFVNIKSQQWSVLIINPKRPKLSTWLIVGGAFIRWSMVAVTFLLALRISFIMMFFTFSAFIVVKILIILKLHGLSDRKNQAIYIKD